MLPKGAYRLVVPDGTRHSATVNIERLHPWHESDHSKFPHCEHTPKPQTVPLPDGSEETRFQVERFYICDWTTFPPRYYVQFAGSADAPLHEHRGLVEETPDLIDHVCEVEEQLGHLPEQGITARNKGRCRAISPNLITRRGPS